MVSDGDFFKQVYRVSPPAPNTHYQNYKSTNSFSQIAAYKGLHAPGMYSVYMIDLYKCYFNIIKISFR